MRAGASPPGPPLPMKNQFLFYAPPAVPSPHCSSFHQCQEPRTLLLPHPPPLRAFPSLHEIRNAVRSVFPKLRLIRGISMSTYAHLTIYLAFFFLLPFKKLNKLSYKFCNFNINGQAHSPDIQELFSRPGNQPPRCYPQPPSS